MCLKKISSKLLGSQEKHIRVPAFRIANIPTEHANLQPNSEPKVFHSPPPVAIQGAEADPRPESNRLTDGGEEPLSYRMCASPW